MNFNNVCNLGNGSFNVTGTIFTSSDPLNLYLDSLHVDSYSLVDGFFLLTF